MMRNKRINAVDVFIILFLASCVLSAVFRIYGGGIFAKRENLDAYEISFEVVDVSANSKKYFVDGDSFRLPDGVILGTLAGQVSSEATSVYAKGLDGSFVSVKYPENTRVDIFGKILSFGSDNGDGYLLNGVRHIASGDVLSVMSERISVTLKVNEIAKK